MTNDGSSDQWSKGLRRRRFGQRLGRYCLGTLLGSGGAASVYMARLDGPRGFERMLALKIVHEHLLADREFVASFLDEANLATRLQHPNIVHSYELCQDDQTLYLAMEYLHGQPLSRVGQRAIETKQPLPHSLVAWLGARAAEALAYAHSAAGNDGEPLRLVHRDVSPDNLFISYDGQLKLLDFGIAHAARRHAQTNLGQLKGKLRYMAPEYALGHEFDDAVDIFALGATLYEVAVGEPAFGDDEQTSVHRSLLGDVKDPRDLLADFPPLLWRVIQGMLEADPALRLGPAATVARELDAIAGLTFAQGRALLAITMERLFSAEKAADLADAAELRGLLRSEAESTEHGHVLANAPTTKRRSSLKFVALGAAALLIPVLFMRSGRAPVSLARPLQPVPAASVQLLTEPPPRAVDIAVAASPSGVADVEVEIDRVVVKGGESHRLIPRSTTPVRVRVSAPGYRSAEVDVVPDRDQSLLLSLTRAVRPTPPVSAKEPRIGSPSPPAESAGIIKNYPF
jgi:eukaryotic-like serine/threonine-protein kinase